MGAEDEGGGAAKAPPDAPLFDMPSWAGKPASGMHLDVLKGDKGLIQKLMIDEKRAYYFGRNPAQCDFTVDHASASRVHAVLVYHAHLKRAFLVDLGSTHGTYIGSVRLEARKPEQVQSGQSFHFGASTRRYVLREKPSASGVDGEGGGLRAPGSLPTKEEELENLTEYNTALNRRIGNIAAVEETPHPNRKRKRLLVYFNDEEDVINPEDIDPSVGRFRNLVATTVIKKRAKGEDPFQIAGGESEGPHHGNRVVRRIRAGEDDDESGSGRDGEGPAGGLGGMAAASLGLALMNPAPEVGPEPAVFVPRPVSAALPLAKRAGGGGVGSVGGAEEDLAGHHKKKYAKEAWPGREKDHARPFL